MYTSTEVGEWGRDAGEKLQFEGEPLVAGEPGPRGDAADAAAEVTPGFVPAKEDPRLPVGVGLAP
jgi:hypothetical protein